MALVSVKLNTNKSTSKRLFHQFTNSSLYSTIYSCDGRFTLEREACGFLCGNLVCDLLLLLLVLQQQQQQQQQSATTHARIHTGDQCIFEQNRIDLFNNNCCCCCCCCLNEQGLVVLLLPPHGGFFSVKRNFRFTFTCVDSRGGESVV